MLRTFDKSAPFNKICVPMVSTPEPQTHLTSDGRRWSGQEVRSV